MDNFLLQAKNFIARPWLLPGLLAVYVMIIWWPTKNLPYHWDAAGLVIPYAQSLYENNFSLLVRPGIYGTHGPLLMYLVAFAWKAFGHNPLSAHLIILPFAWMYLWFSYLVARYWLGNKFGLGFIAWLGLMPVYVAQIGQVYIDLPTAGLSLASWWMMLRQKWWSAGIILALALLTKESAVIFLVWWWIWLWFERKRVGLKAWLSSCIPLVTYGIYLLINRRVFGYLWFIPNYDRQMPADWSITTLLEMVQIQVRYIFINQSRWFWIVLGLWGAIIWLGLNREVLEARLKYFGRAVGLMLVLGLAFFTLAGQAHARYYLLLAPIYLLIPWWGLRIFWQYDQLIPRSIKSGMIVSLFIGCACWQFSLWQPQPKPNGYYFESMDMDLSYYPMLKSWIEAADYIENNYPDSLVLGSFPEVYQLTQPYQGYVEKPIEFNHCIDAIETLPQKIERQTLVIVHHYIPLQGNCETIVQQHQGRLLERFENEGWWVEVYEISTKSDASDTSQSFDSSRI